MSSSWRGEIGAVLAKEARTELRTKAGLLNAGLFAFSAVVAMALAAFNLRVSGQLASGMLWVVLLFAASVALPRAFLLEEEQGTGDLLRLMARPPAVYWGKALFNLAQMLGLGIAVGALLVGLLGQTLAQPGLFAVALLGGCGALASAVTLCGALVAQAQNRGALAAAVSLPLVVPLVMWGVAAMRAALGTGSVETGWSSALGLLCYAVLGFTVGPYLFTAVWKN